MHAMQRSPELWRQPLAFLPERFVAGSPEAEEVSEVQGGTWVRAGQCEALPLANACCHPLLSSAYGLRHMPVCATSCLVPCCRWCRVHSFPLAPAAACAWACGLRS